MIKPNRTSIIITALLLFFFFSAQTLLSQDNQGEIQIYLFSHDGIPVQNAQMEVNGVIHRSNASGFILFTDYPGNHEYAIYYQDRLVARVGLSIRMAQVIEALVTLPPEGEEPVQMLSEKEEVVPGADETPEEDFATGPKGILSGTLRHIESGETVAGATILFRGINRETLTDEKGYFSVELPPGTYSISLIHKDYSSRTLDNLEVREGEENWQDILLTPSAITLDAHTVFASTEVRVKGGEADLIEETKNSGVVLNLIGTEQMSKSGDSNAASALNRVTGLTIVDGRYVFVRGMGERYSSSYLNGARLPSPEIDKRVVPLDLFPTSVLESMAVQKAFSPALYGDFGGGSVSLRTSGIPNDRYKRRLRTIIGTSIGYDMNSTFTEQLMDTAGSLDFLGFDDGGRGLPDSVGEEQVTSGSGLFSGMSDEEVAQIARDMNRDWDGRTGRIPLDFGTSISLRDKVSFDKGSELGWNLSLLYKNGWDSSEEDISNYSSVDPPGIYYDYHSVNTRHDVDLGGLWDLEFRSRDQNKWGMTTLLVRTTDNEVQHYEGFFTSDSAIFSVTNISWVESTLFSQQLSSDIGLPVFNESRLKLNYSFSLANRYEPGNSSIIYVMDDNPYTDDELQLYYRSNAAQRYFANVQDKIHDGSIHWNIPFFWLKNESADFLELGAQVMLQNRISDVRRFAYGPESGTLLDLSLDPDLLFVDSNIGDEIGFAEYTQETDNYSGSHCIIAGYAQGDMLLPLDIRLNAGVRAEYSDQQVSTFNLFGGTQSSARLQNLNFLPSVNLTIPLQEKMQIRLGGSKTVNRPDLRELSDAPKYGVAGSGVFTGNPDLLQAEILHGDLRWEYYISEKENLSAGIFYKNFTNAIEMVNQAGAGDPTTLANVPSAYNLGLELEWRLSMRYLSDGIRKSIIRNKPSPSMRKFQGGLSGVFRDLTLSGNISWIQSEIDYRGEQGINTNETRPLQGQSPWILNASLGYRNSVSWSQDKKTHSNINLNYNLFGPRISRIGVYGTPDYYEQPFHQLNLVVKHSFNEIFTIGLQMNNILDLPYQEKLGDLVVNEKRRGRSISISGKLDI